MSSDTVTRSQTRQGFSVVDGGQDPPSNRPPSSSGSDCGVIEFSKEDVEALLSEKLEENKFNYNYKEKNDRMDDCIKRLKQCIRWFQHQEGNYVTEQEKLKNLLELSEKKCGDVELLMKAKEDELNSIVKELVQWLDKLQEKHAMEEIEKLEAINSLAQERESKLAAEKAQASLFEELKRTQEDNATNIEKLKASQNEGLKQNDALASEVTSLRGDLQQVRDDRDRQLFQVQALSAEVAKYKEAIGKSIAESTCLCQNEQIRRLQEQLTHEEKKRKVML